MNKSLWVLFLLAMSLCAAVRAADVPLDANGIVTDEFGKPIAGATVEFVRDREPDKTLVFEGIEIMTSAISAADGTFHITANIPKAEYFHWRLRAVARGRGYSGLSIQRDPQKPFFDTMRQAMSAKPWIILPPARSIHGVIVDRNGQPIAGCEVFNGNLRDPVRSGADGKFAIENVADLTGLRLTNITSIAFSHPDFVRQIIRDSEKHDFEKTDDGGWRIVLDHGIVVSGRVTEEPSGNELSLVYVSASSYRGESNLFTISTMTDARGRYLLRVPPGQITFRTSLYVQPENPNSNLMSVERETNRTFDGDALEELNFTFRRGQSISGHVAIPHKITADTLTVEATPIGNSTSSSRSVTCDEKGAFAILALSPGQYELRISERRTSGPSSLLRSKQVEVVEGEDLTGLEIAASVPIELPSEPSLGGRVLAADGSVVPLALVNVISKSGENERMFSDLDGAFVTSKFDRFSDCLAFITSPSENLAALVDVQPTPFANNRIEAKLQPTAEIKGKVYDELMQPLAGVWVYLFYGIEHGSTGQQISVAATTTDGQGNYVIRGVIVPEGVGRFAIQATPPLRESLHQVRSGGHPIVKLDSGQIMEGVNFRYVRSSQNLTISAE